MNRFRYPGPQPFTDQDQELFFGREEEKQQLINLIQANRLNILFGRSGNGKSSLIHAAIIPYFTREQYKIVEIRVQPFQNDSINKDSLKIQIVNEFKKNLDSENIFLEELSPENDDTSLWQYFKTLQWDAIKKGFEGVIVIIDQFEEFFKFPPDEYRQFAKELSEIIYNRTPYKFQLTLNDIISSRKDFLAENRYKIDFIKNEIHSSFLVGIRSDRLYLLDELGDVIPIIFNNRFRLDHLNKVGLERAIRYPAQTKGFFSSPTFDFCDRLVADIVQYLYKDRSNVQQSSVETFQLQIICEFIERKVIDYLSNNPADEIDNIIVTKAFLQQELVDVISQYYQNIVHRTTSRDNPNGNASYVQQLLVRFLIERRLIEEKTNSRICLDKTSIHSIGIEEIVLERLFDSKIIRKEINTVSGESLEISHDSLIDPIQQAAMYSDLGDLDKNLYNYYIETFKSLSFIARWNFNTMLLKKMINDQGSLLSIKRDNLPQNLIDIVSHLDEKQILQKNTNRDNIVSYVINEPFKSSILKKQAESNNKRQNDIKIVLIGAAILFVFLFSYSLEKNNQHRVDTAKIFLFRNVLWFSTAASKAYYGSPQNDTIVKKLLLLSEVYNTIKADTTTSTYAAKIFTDFFNSHDFLGRRLVTKGLYPTSYDFNNKNELLVIYSNQQLTSNYGDKARQTAILYNRYGKVLEIYHNIMDAAFDKRTTLLILYKDSLIIKNGDSVKRLRLTFKNMSSGAITKINIFSISTTGIVCSITRRLSSSDSKKQQLTVPQNFSIITPLNADEIDETVEISFKGSVVSHSLDIAIVPQIINETNSQMLNQPSCKHLTVAKSDRTIFLKSGTNKRDSLVMDYPISDIYFSATCDTIFVYDSNSIILLNNSLRKLSKFISGKPRFGYSKNTELIASVMGDYIVLIDLKDPVIKNINTTNPQQVYKYVTGKNHMVTWSSLNRGDREKFEFNIQ